jgi:hypothetical protein
MDGRLGAALSVGNGWRRGSSRENEGGSAPGVAAGRGEESRGNGKLRLPATEAVEVGLEAGTGVALEGSSEGASIAGVQKEELRGSMEATECDDSGSGEDAAGRLGDDGDDAGGSGRS